MKKCPFCAEEIQDEAIKCKHCGERLDQPKPGPENPPAERGSGIPFLKVIGILLLLGGVGAGVYFSQFHEVGVYVPATTIAGRTLGGGKVANDVLMQNRQNGMIVSLVVAAAGLACALVGHFAGGQSAQVQSVGARKGGGRLLFWVIFLAILAAAIALIVREGNKADREIQKERSRQF